MNGSVNLHKETIQALGRELEGRFRRVLSDMMCEKFTTGRNSDVTNDEWLRAKLQALERAGGHPGAVTGHCVHDCENSLPSPLCKVHGHYWD